MRCNLQGIAVTEQPIDLFPGASFQLATHDSDLIPRERDLLRDASGKSYWDITLSPGNVWIEESDQGWSRAALPFQLSNIFENDTHHGIATFLYNESETTSIYYQIVAETKTFMCPANLIAYGYLQPTTKIVNNSGMQSIIQAFQQEQKDQFPMQSLENLRNNDTEGAFLDIESGFGSNSTLISGLVFDDTVYHSDAATPFGRFPYPRAMKFGIWSATKTAFCSIACLRLAQKFGSDPRIVKVADVLPEAANNQNWQDITIGDCLNMASGIGTAGRQTAPLNIFADYLLEKEQSKASEIALKSYNHYFDWFLAPSQHEKNMAAFACPPFPWPAGSITRYRDQDLYIAGAALDAWLKQQSDNSKRIWNLLCDEVYTPIGLHHPVQFHTIESDQTKEVPLSDAGLLLTMDNIAALGRLIHNRGKHENTQLLDAGMLQEWFDPSIAKGLPTGIHIKDGEVHYHGGIWHLPFVSSSKKRWWLPTMRGYGGQAIQTLPNGMTTFRFGFDSYETEERYDFLKLAKLADTIKPF